MRVWLLALLLSGCYLAVEPAEPSTWPSVTEALVDNQFEPGRCYLDDRGSGGHPNLGVVSCGEGEAEQVYDCLVDREHCGACNVVCEGRCVDGACE